MKIVKIKNISKEHLNKNLLIRGWIYEKRILGKIAFIILRDYDSLIQLVYNDKSEINKIKNINYETLIKIEGILKLKKNIKNTNNSHKFEINVLNTKILKNSKELPFMINDKIKVTENNLYKYRYLSLRNFEIKKPLILRSKIFFFIRKFLINDNFLEIETPILSDPNFEGAKEFLVPYKRSNSKLNCYSLAQSPQIYKQLLINSLFEKYFQIAKCFRDEDLRENRQPEFTQLDLEISMAKSDDVIELIEKLIQSMFKTILNINLNIPFKRINYNDAISLYGSDSPDIRFENYLYDITTFFDVKNIDNKEKILSFCIEQKITKKLKSQINEISYKYNSKEIKFLCFENNNFSDVKHLISNKTLDKIKKNFNLNTKKTYTILILKDYFYKVYDVLGAIRKFLGKELELYKNNNFNFYWIIKWPLFHYDYINKKYNSVHHPFTAPENKYSSLKTARSQAYDLVLNGEEIGGGSVRINDSKLQHDVLQFLGFDKNNIEKYFNFFLESFNYGSPQSAGIAIGLDRLIMLMTKSYNIREVIAFPKSHSGYDMMRNNNDFEKEIENLKTIINENKK